MNILNHRVYEARISRLMYVRRKLRLKFKLKRNSARRAPDNGARLITHRFTLRNKRFLLIRISRSRNTPGDRNSGIVKFKKVAYMPRDFSLTRGRANDDSATTTSVVLSILDRDRFCDLSRRNAPLSAFGRSAVLIDKPREPRDLNPRSG